MRRCGCQAVKFLLLDSRSAIFFRASARQLFFVGALLVNEVSEEKFETFLFAFQAGNEASEKKDIAPSKREVASQAQDTRKLESEEIN